MKQHIIPSIIAQNEKEMLTKINKVKKQTKILQLDVMDGKFVKNKSLWFNINKRKISSKNLEYEAHLMIKNPNAWIKKNHHLAKTIIFHIESVKNPNYTIKLIKSYGKKAGIAIHPKTTKKRFEEYLPHIDQLVILTVKPGRYGATFIPKMLDKVKAVRKEYPKLDIEVDGGINNNTIQKATKAGANKFIVGSYLMKTKKTKDLKRRITMLKDKLKKKKKEEMKIFIDSADIEEIEQAYSYGILDGVTTNPSLIKKAAEKHKVKDMEEYIKEILKTAKGTPVSLEVIGTNHDDIVEEAKTLYKKFNGIAKNVVIKVPVNPCLKEKCEDNMDGIKAIKTLSYLNIPVNCTLIFTPEQALLAAKAGATYISPFAGRIDDLLRTKTGTTFNKTDYYPAEGKTKGKKRIEDNGIYSGIDLVEQCVDVLQETETQVLAASIRNTKQFRECALIGSHIATVPLQTINELLTHKETTKGMKAFVKDIIKEYKEIFKN